MEIVCLTFPAEAVDGYCPSATLCLGRSSLTDASLIHTKGTSGFGMWRGPVEMPVDVAFCRSQNTASLQFNPPHLSTENFWNGLYPRVSLSSRWLQALNLWLWEDIRLNWVLRSQEALLFHLDLILISLPVGELSIFLEGTKESGGLQGCNGRSTVQPPPANCLSPPM